MSATGNPLEAGGESMASAFQSVIQAMKQIAQAGAAEGSNSLIGGMGNLGASQNTLDSNFGPPPEITNN